MVSKVQQTERGSAVLLPADALEELGLTADSEISITVDAVQKRIVIAPISQPLPDIDEEFARQVSDFIAQYRPALEALAR
jgi:antitoxin component of MazEF toxin-antitoxin module